MDTIYIIGALVGLWPFIKGMKANQEELSFVGLFTSSMSGILEGPLLSIPVALIFVWLIKNEANEIAEELV